MSAPFPNCRFRECDLPGQCRSEGKCHHPAIPQAASQPKSLTVQKICDIWLEQTGTPEVDAPYPIIEFALAILEAAK
jgi:hypothetical protein